MLQKEDISIIVVDDLQFSCEVVKSGLKKSGYKDIRTANSANKAMLLLNERRADVILADFWMPEMNGLELTDLIRRWDEKNNRYTGIILLTAEDTTSSIVVAFEHGVDDFVSKSANQYELAARVYGAGRISVMHNNVHKLNSELTTLYQNNHRLNLIDNDTGLSNYKQFERTLESMIIHCETRGGGIAIGLIRVDVDGDEATDNKQLTKLRPGTLRTISNALQLVLRPMDEIARIDSNTFAIALIYADQNMYNTDMFKRSTASILKHAHLLTNQGKNLKLSIACWNTSDFDPIPSVPYVLEQAESHFSPLELEPEN
jgi:PleD family two-component response regulator